MHLLFLIPSSLQHWEPKLCCRAEQGRHEGTGLWDRQGLADQACAAHTELTLCLIETCSACDAGVDGAGRI